MQQAAVSRYHSLDALRAAMMLLGLVLHSAAGYTQTPIRAAWPFQDPQRSAIFDLTLVYIHLFRMPVFFVVAGFFGALLYHRDGAAEFIRNRASRVLLPLPLFWVAVMPLVGLGFVFATGQINSQMPLEPMPGVPFWRQSVLGHLWFLYDLCIFYGFAAIVVPVAARAPGAIRLPARRTVRRVITSHWGILALAGVTIVTLLPMEAGGLDTSAALLPPVRVLAAYGVFFAFGWLLFGQRDTLPDMAARWRGRFIGGLCASAAYLVVAVAQTGFTDARTWHHTAVAVASVAMWLTILGIFGLFLRRLDTPRPWIRYFSDASYWMYLTHLVPIVWMQGLLAHGRAPAVVKFGIVLGVTTLVTAVTYHYAVRSTVVGELLNGRRYPRTLPAVPRPVAPI